MIYQTIDYYIRELSGLIKTVYAKEKNNCFKCKRDDDKSGQIMIGWFIISDYNIFMQNWV